MNSSKKCKMDKISTELNAKRKKPGQGADAKRVSLRLFNFNPKESPAYKKIQRLFPNGISHPELKRIAEILSQNCCLSLDRDAKRDNRVLIKWFDENWAIINNEIERIKVFDENCDLLAGNELKNDECFC